MNAIGYTRISTVEQSAYSLDYQERSIRDYCRNNKLDLLSIFRDDGQSSYTFDRADWDALEKFIKKTKNVQYLVVLDYDRFSRNLAEALLKIKELESRYGIKTIATTDRIDTDFTDPSNFMMRAFKLLIAENELHSIRKRTKNGILQATLDGRHPNLAPYGYINARDENNKALLKVDEEKAIVVKLIFKEYNRGAGIEETRRIAQQYGFTKKNNSAIQRILGNPVYAGLIRVPAHKNKPESIIKGLHEPIVSEYDYWQAHARLNGRTVSRQNNDDVPLRGIISHSCGSIMTAGRSRGKSGKHYWYYVCHQCKVNISANKAHQLFGEILDHFSWSQEKIEVFTSELTEAIRSHLDDQSQMQAETLKAIRGIQAKINNTEEKFLSQDSISKSTFNKVMNNLRSQLSVMQHRMHELQSDNDLYFDRVKTLVPALHDIRGLVEKYDLATRQQFIRLVFDNYLSFDGEAYRTRKLISSFSHNAVILKEKGLLEIEQTLIGSDVTPISTEDGSSVELLRRLADILVA